MVSTVTTHSFNSASTFAKQLVLGGALLFAGTAAVQAQGLPDFASLVKNEGKAVVNIAVTSAVQPASLTQQPNLEQIPEQYRRFFEQPGQNQQPRSFNESGVGSGFIVSEDGYILTNAHVVDNASNITVRMRDRHEFTASLVGLDELTDVALLKVEADDLPVVRISDDENVSVGEWVLAIGSPFGFDQSATQGIVSAASRSLPSGGYVPFIQTDVAVNPGNSGGPLFNTDGEVIGINSQIYSSTGGYQGLSFAIPIDIAMDVAEQLKESGKTSRGWLGVGIQDVNQELAASFGLDRVTGALVASVGENSPAEQGGIQEGDIVLEFNGRTVNRSSELPSLVGATRGGAMAKVTVFRNGKSQVLDVRIGKRGEDTVAAAPVDSTLGMDLSMLASTTENGSNPDAGVQVIGIELGSVAEAAGIQLEDIIVKFNGEVTNTPSDVIAAANALPVGKPIPVLVQRGDNALFLTLTVPTTLE